MKKVVYFFIFFQFIQQVHSACVPNIFNLCRDGDISKNFKFKRTTIKGANNSYLNDRKNTDELSDLLDSITRPVSAIELFRKVQELDSYKESIEKCISTIAIRKNRNCVKEEVRKVLYVLVSKGKIDNLSAIIIHNSLVRDKKFKKKIIGLKEYSNKLMLLKNKPFSNSCFACLQKGYKYGGFRGLSLAQYMLLKYNYFQISELSSILKKFSQRIEASQSGLFFDYDGDGNMDEIIELDPAEQYRLSVKLLKMSLNKSSRSGEVLYGKDPQTVELLGAVSILGEIDDDLLLEIFEMPFFKKKKTSNWKKALKVTESVAKWILTRIPGVNLYLSIPLVALESYREIKRKNNENSNLHIFTF